uniref:Cadherin domain-containing protein n=1 Tax=Trichobilharzia regenti TaxID=157069 RepID=A0AA85IPH7_TRIRE|nr:unnamed protein product [Trichobilharzia regenti]
MTVNTYNNFYTMFILLHVTLFITHCTNFIQTTSSPPVDHEYYIQEEVSIGTLIGNLMNDVVLKYAELGLLKISHKLGQLPDDSDEYYTLKIVNFADPYVNLFEIKTDGRLIVNRRLDRDQICSGQPQLDSSIITGEQTQSVSNIYSNLRQQTNIQAESTSCPIILQIGLFTHHKNSMTSKLETDIKEKKQNRLFYIRINIQDINDNAPYWQGHLQRFRITFLDGDPVGSRRNIPPAIDIDAGSNGHITYELSSANLFDKSPIPFSLLEDSTDGLHLYATKPVDREEQSEYKLMLKAIDGSYTPSTSTSSVLSNESNLKRFTSTLYLDVLIEDVNDNTPQFTQPIFTTAMPIPETTPVGTTILILNATDLDSGINGIYHFGFSKDHYWQPNEKIARHYFDIRPNGQIIVRQPLNVDKLDLNINHNKNNNNNPMLSNLRIRQQLNDDISMHNSKGVNLQFRFRAIVEDEATRPYTRSSEATVIILVTDENDESPIITVRHNPEAINTNTLDSVSLPNPFSYFSVFENQPIGTVVASIQVYDPDFGGQDQVECNLKDANFSLTRHAAQNKPDYDQNNAANSLTEYHLVTSRILDRESTTHQIVTVICSDMVGHYTERNITIRIMDENDNPPKFSHDTFHLQVDENAPVGTLVRQQIQKNTRGHFNNIYQNGLSQWLQATDLDTGINSEMKYFLLEDGVNSTRFKIDSLTGIITTLDVFDREVKDTYTLNVVAVDQGTPQLTGTATLQITINDLNDNGPIFSQNDYTFHIQENQPRSTIVGQVSATDLDSSLFAPLEYSITDDQESVNFTIDKITGIIRSRQSLDREEKSHYAFRVLVKDTRMRLTEVSNSLSGSHGNSINSPLPMNIRYTGTTTVTVIVDDVNDNWPVFISPNSTANTLAIAIDQKVTGYKLAYIQAYDKDDGENGLIRYSILAGNNYGLFGLDSTSGLLYLSNPINQKDSNKDNMLHNSSSDASLSNDGYDVMHILQKSSMHILTLEACDHGKDPKPRCTLYNNLKIIIQNNRENNINNMENTQSQYSLFGQVINIPETLGSSSSSSATSEKSSLSMMQANYDNNQNHLNSIQELNDDSVYQNPTALPYGNLLSNKQSYKTLGYTANDIMIICLSLIFSLVLIATLVLICLVRRRVTWFKSKDKNSVKSEPVSQWGNQTVCQTSLINNQNIPPYGSNKLPGSTSENTSSICHSPEEFSKSATNNKNNTSSNNNDFNGNFISLQNSLHKSLLLPEESGSSRSIYHYTTSLPPTLVTQTQTTMPMATTIDYKRYGCNTHEMNNKFHQLKTSTTGNNGDVFNTLTTARKSNENNITCNNKFGKSGKSEFIII